MADWLLMSFGPSMPLSFKIAAPVLVTTALVATVLGWSVVGYMHSQLDSAYDRQSDSIAAGVQAIFVTAPDDTHALDIYLANVQHSEPALLSLRIHGLDSGTTVLASSDPSEVGKTGLVEPDDQQAIWSGISRRDHESTSRGNVVRAVRPLRIGNVRFGAVLITSSEAPEEVAARSMSLIIAASALAAIIVESTFVLAVLYFGILRRTRRLQRAISAVESGDTSVRLEEGAEPPARDVMFNLARQVDHMIGRLDERHRADVLVRRLGQRALERVTAVELVSEGLTATRFTLGLESCILVRVDREGSIVSAINDGGTEVNHLGLPVWVGALVGVSVRARKPVLTDRFGQGSRYTEPGEELEAQAAIVPLPRTDGAGEAIIAIAPVGTMLPDLALAVLESVAATIAESNQRTQANQARHESEAKSKVMAAVSHEMRNPLNSIMGFTGLVLSSESEPLTEKQRRHLGHVQSSANNMLAIVNNYLDLAKTRSGSLPLQLQTLLLRPAIEEAVATLQPMAAARKVDIKVSIADGTAARVDPTRFAQALTNLVSNALKFTPEGGHVFVRARPDRNSTRLVVSDTGVGIRKEERSLVFTEFAKIDAGAQSRSKGTGLGLVLTKGFVEAMGGTITFHSRLGRGTTFVIKLQASGTDKTSESRAA